MNTAEDNLIAALRDDLTPVRRTLSSGWRMAAWLGVIAAVAATAMAFADLPSTLHRLANVSALRWAMLGAMLTALAAGYAAIRLSVPDGRPVWAWMPLAPLLLWAGASGWGCLDSIAAPNARMPDMNDHADCFRSLVLIAIPLWTGLILILRRSYSLHPRMALAMGGLACAGAAATLLNFIHPLQATAADLVTHLVALVLIFGFGGVVATMRRSALVKPV